jgi:hypothetical protein
MYCNGSFICLYRKRKCRVNISTLHFFFVIFFNYKEEPNPEYDPKKKKPNIVITAKPPTNAISQRGTRLFVSAIKIEIPRLK